MAQQFKARRVAEGRYVKYTHNAAVAVGDVLAVNGLLLIAEHAFDANVEGAYAVEGTFDLVKVNGSLSIGSSVYWDEDGNPQGGTAGSGALTSTSAGNTPAGRVVAAAGATDEKVRIKLFNSPSVTNTVTSVSPAANEIADPGNGQAIPVDASGTIMLVSGAGNETRTVADPEFVGQEHTYTMKTDGGGDIVIASASAINQAGNNRMTFANVRDTIKLVAIEAAAGLVWQVAYNDGVALSTV